MSMTKTSVNKIPFDGPKSHTEIVAKIRTEVKDISRERISLIVSSFFTTRGIFRFVREKKVISVSYFGRILPALAKYSRIPKYTIKRRKKRAAIEYLTHRHQLACGAKIRHLTFMYEEWNINRKEKGLPESDFKTYLYTTRHKMPVMKKIRTEDILSLIHI